MTLYFCLDDRGGMLFNHRRQSRDGAVLEDIRGLATGELWIDPMSRKLLDRAGIPCTEVPEDLPEDLEGRHYFVESRPAGEWISLAERVVIYRWNRHYPGDQYFDVDLSALGFALAETTEFPGSSHEKITREVYVK